MWEVEEAGILVVDGSTSVVVVDGSASVVVTEDLAAAFDDPRVAVVC